MLCGNPLHSLCDFRIFVQHVGRFHRVIFHVEERQPDRLVTVLAGQAGLARVGRNIERAVAVGEMQTDSDFNPISAPNFTIDGARVRLSGRDIKPISCRERAKLTEMSSRFRAVSANHTLHTPAGVFM